MPHSHAPQAGADSGHTGSSNSQRQRRLLIVLALTFGYMLAEVVVGFRANSLAVLADAGHTLTDAIGIGLIVVAVWFGRRPATPARTYGFYRLEILATLANCVLLFGIACLVIIEALRRFGSPPEVDSLPMLVVAVIALCANLLGAWVLHGGGESLATRSVRLDLLADTLGAVGVIVAALVIAFTGWPYADPLVSIAIGLLILPRTWGLLKSTVDILLEATPEGVDTRQIESALAAVPGVASIHELHIWTITSGFVAMSAHVTAQGRASGDVLHDLQGLLRERFGIEHATIQVEQPDHADDGACCTLDARCLVVGQRARAAASSTYKE